MGSFRRVAIATLLVVLLTSCRSSDAESRAGDTRTVTAPPSTANPSKPISLAALAQPSKSTGFESAAEVDEVPGAFPSGLVGTRQRVEHGSAEDRGGSAHSDSGRQGSGGGMFGRAFPSLGRAAM